MKVRSRLATLATGGVVIAGLFGVAAGPAMANATCVNSVVKLFGSPVPDGRIAADVQAAILANTGASSLTALYGSIPKNEYQIAVQQYITTALNGTPGDSLDPSSALGKAFYGLSTYFQYPNDPSFTQFQVAAWTLTLLSYNQGWSGTPSCTSIKPPPPPKTTDCHGYQSYYLTGAYNKQSWGSWSSSH